MCGNKIVSLCEAEKIASELRLAGLRLVLTNGCFDLLHRGHVECLIEAARLGDVLMVAVNSDSSISKLKGSDRPLTCQEDRLFILAALGCVDYVVLLEDDHPGRLIERLKPQVLAKGSDWPVDKIIGRAFVEQNGGRVVSLDSRVPHYSTTNLISKIRNAANGSRY